MGLIEIVEKEVDFNAAITKIKCVDSNATDSETIKEFCMKMSVHGKAIPSEVATMIYNRIARTGKTAKEVIEEMEEQIHE